MTDPSYPPATRLEALQRLRDALAPHGCRLSDMEAGAAVDALWEAGSRCHCGKTVVPR